MTLHFGENLVAITSGLKEVDGNKYGIVKFQKLFKPNLFTESNMYDIPIVFKFKTSDSVDIVIEALQHAKEIMLEDTIK